MAGRLHPKQLAQAGATNGQALVYSTVTNQWQPGSVSGGLSQKAGTVLKASFSGNPKTTTVTFATPFVDANYAIVFTLGSTGNSGFGPAWNSKTANGFVINMNVNNINKLVAVDWIAMKYGES